MKSKESKSEAKDPICGMSVNKATAFHVERDGKTYYFCGDHCRDKFLSTKPGVKIEPESGCCCG